MPPDHQFEPVAWRDGTPVSPRFDDPYFSLADGLAETRHVFLDGNDLPGRFAPGFAIAELGFGTGLNLLAAWDAWQRHGIAGRLHYTSFEAHPISARDMAQAHAAFPALAPLSEVLCSAWSQGPEADLPGLRLRVILGDAARTLPAWEGAADAWFLDGFAPARNPGLWTPALLVQVWRHTRAGGTAASYSAAGAVRRGLSEAGFSVTRVAGYGRKRHMTRAVRA
ncbi:FAD-dependent oxidoreductase [Rhodobacteraceae bacterium CCMM004]|nr:FAD-dependent oxidoreductase [Rhodobacteraceae bacterium CCMM004]